MIDENTRPVDVVIVGSGVAGLSAAVRATDLGLRVGLVTKGDLDQATTRWAQGGVAAVLGGDPDSTDSHLADTLAAGVGLCDIDAVRILVDEGPRRVEELIALGARFDRGDTGDYSLAREGGHSHARVLHAGGAATGVEVERALVEAIRARAASIEQRCFATELVVDGDGCAGIEVLDEQGERRTVAARHVLLASGGAGQLFAVTTNPPVATGDGIAIGLRAGADIADLEFVQFHPTALHHSAMPRPLISEALRGHGALLRDTDGERFVDELEPRDVVSRAMTKRMRELGVEHCYLDATMLQHFNVRFPTIAASLERVGLDPTTDWLPVSPAAHYTCGGLMSDLDGATSVPGLWAAGEVSCSGVHGANRLASNSLLDGMVYGARVVEAIAAGKRGADATGVMRTDTDVEVATRRLSVERSEPESTDGASTAERRARLQQLMTDEVGLLRSADGLARAKAAVGNLRTGAIDDVAACELRNLCDLADVTVALAAERTESRGAHSRMDHPEAAPRRYRLVASAPVS